MLITGAVGATCLPSETTGNDGFDGDAYCGSSPGVDIGIAGEVGIMPGIRESGRGEGGVDSFMTSCGYMGRPSSAGIGISNASATDATTMDALLNRAAGSLARQRKIAFDIAGGMPGLMRSGGVGIVLICCTMIAGADSPWNGGTPVQIS